MIIRHNKFVPTRNGAGFSMIDVLVAIIVLATALLALAALQGALTRNTADARSRSQIAAYSEGLIDQLRSSGFDSIAAGTISPSSGTATQKAAATAAQTAAGISGLQTTVTVATYAADSTGAFAVATGTVDQDAGAYKQVDISSAWTDASGQSRTLKLDTIISPVTVDTSNNTLVSKSTPPSTSQTPTVREYNPAATAGVIPIAIGTTGNDTAATNPKPELLAVSNKSNALVGTSFNVLTFQAPDSSNETVIQQRVENRVIRCSCKYGAGITDTTNVFAQPYRPTYWGKDAKYVAPTATTAKTSSTGVDSTAVQDEFCDICCRDRNDTTADTVKFDPFATGSSPDYSHYRYDSTDTLVKVPSSDTTDAYLNACRLIRVDGQYRTATDMQNYFFGLLATTDQSSASTAATSPIPDPTYVTSYQAFVTSYLTDSITSLAAGTGPDSTAAAAGMYTTASLDNPTNIFINYSSSTTDYRYLHARGLYIDHLESETLTAINNAITNCPTTSTLANCVLPLLPFTTINETELANWTVTPVVTGDATNVNNDIQVSDTYLIDGDPSAPLRGVVNALSSSTNANTAKAVATIGLSNSGVTGEDISDAAVDMDDKATLTDSQKFTISKGSTVSTVSWTVGFSGITELSGISNISLDPSMLWSGTAAQLGTKGSGSCPGTLTKTNGHTPTYTPSYSCTTAVTTTPPVALSLTVQNFNQQISVSQTVSGCGTSSWPVAYCQNYAVNTAAITVNGTAVAGATSSLLTGTTDGGLKEGALISIPSPPGLGTNKTSPYDIVNIGFTLQSSTLQAGTCTSSTKGSKTTYSYAAGTCAN